MSPTRSILFLCTGNYYRSRFAEEYFNHLATDRTLLWTADSAGLSDNITQIRNVGPISAHARKELDRLEIPLRGGERFPRSVQLEELETADRIIAVNAPEHRPMAERRFPAWADRMEFWTVQDIQFEEVESALGTIRRKVDELVAELPLVDGR